MTLTEYAKHKQWLDMPFHQLCSFVEHFRPYIKKSETLRLETYIRRN